MKKLDKKPDFSFEKKWWNKGAHHIAGLDEVGRGSFAGPLVVGCVIFDRKVKTPDDVVIHDSKKLTPKKRKKAESWIKENAIEYSLGEVSVEEIDREGIGKATHIAFRRAVKKVQERDKVRVDYLFIDAFYIPHIRGFPREKKQHAIKNGDSRSFSIAAASIIAKEYRDRLMEKLSQKKDYEKYMWHKNKGYGTREHREVLTKHGPTKYHRTSFIKNYLVED